MLSTDIETDFNKVSSVDGFGTDPIPTQNEKKSVNSVDIVALKCIILGTYLKIEGSTAVYVRR